MMSDGCTTFHYLDDLRAVPGKDGKNLDSRGACCL
jgi:hypothetical protein